MSEKAQAVVKELLEKFSLTRELLADKMKVTTRTIERWSTGETNPTYAELKLLKQILNGYRNNPVDKK